MKNFWARLFLSGICAISATEFLKGETGIVQFIVACIFIFLAIGFHAWAAVAFFKSRITESDHE